MQDAGYLNSVRDLTNYSWLLEPVQTIMTRVIGKIFSVSNLSCDYHQAPLRPKTPKLTSFIIVKDSIPTHVDSMVSADSQTSSADSNDGTIRSPYQEETSNHLH